MKNWKNTSKDLGLSKLVSSHEVYMKLKFSFKESFRKIADVVKQKVEGLRNDVEIDFLNEVLFQYEIDSNVVTGEIDKGLRRLIIERETKTGKKINYEYQLETDVKRYLPDYFKYVDSGTRKGYLPPYRKIEKWTSVVKQSEIQSPADLKRITKKVQFGIRKSGTPALHFIEKAKNRIVERFGHKKIIDTAERILKGK